MAFAAYPVSIFVLPCFIRLGCVKSSGIEDGVLDDLWLGSGFDESEKRNGDRVIEEIR